MKLNPHLNLSKRLFKALHIRNLKAVRLKELRVPTIENREVVAILAANLAIVQWITAIFDHGFD